MDPSEVAGKRLSFATKLKYSARIRRVEFIPVGITVILFPVVLAAGGLGEILSGRLALALIAVFSTMHLANLINCYVDRDLDAVYKGRLSEAVHGLGAANIKMQIVVTCVLMAVLGVAIAVITEHYDVLAIVAVQTVLAIQYTTRPLFLKGAGLWQIPALFVLMFFGAGVLAIRTCYDTLDLPVLCAAAGFGAAMMGVVLLNTTEDFPEDREFGVYTSARALGITGAMATGAVLVALGVGATVVGVLATMPAIAVAPIVLAWIPIQASLTRSWIQVRGQEEAVAMPIVRRQAKLVPVYLAIFGWGSTAGALIGQLA
ncbi:UbiA family prenyltransferase [Nocardia sp. NPDC055053]